MSGRKKAEHSTQIQQKNDAKNDADNLLWSARKKQTDDKPDHVKNQRNDQQSYQDRNHL
jgi:hypothetical protein